MMDWIHIEPTHERVSTTVLQNNVNKKIEENEENNITDKVNNSEIIINSLKSENIRLRNIIKRLKYRLRTAQKCRKPRGQKSKKMILKKLIHEQDLHPVAKAMINLQLHTPHASYTEEEKNLSLSVKTIILLFTYYILSLKKSRLQFSWTTNYEEMAGRI